jgi:hypothetical protein
MYANLHVSRTRYARLLVSLPLVKCLAWARSLPSGTYVAHLWHPCETSNKLTCLHSLQALVICLQCACMQSKIVRRSDDEAPSDGCPCPCSSSTTISTTFEVNTNADGAVVVCRNFLGLWCVSHSQFIGLWYSDPHCGALENCRPPSGASGYALVQKIRQVVQPFGSIRTFRAYLDHQEHRNDQLRSELQLSGVSMLDAPHSAAKNVADQMMLGARLFDPSFPYSEQNIQST